MANSLDARLRRLEIENGRASTIFMVVADRPAFDALARAGGIPAGAVVILSGVSRSPNEEEQH